MALKKIVLDIHYSSFWISSIVDGMVEIAGRKKMEEAICQKSSNIRVEFVNEQYASMF